MSDLKEVPWGTAFIYDAAVDAWAHWSSLYKNILDKHAPIKEKWLLVTNCRRFCLKFNNGKYDYETGCLSTLEDILQLKRGNAVKDSVTKSVLSNAKVSRSFAHTQLLHQRTHGNSGGKSKHSFQAHGQTHKVVLIILVENGCVISNPSELAEIFNDNFSNMVLAVQLSAEFAEFYYTPKF